MRGEHSPWLPLSRYMLGSSPHARGTPNFAVRLRARRGIIPACAGNTYFCLQSPRNAGDHPRMRGEHRRVGHDPRAQRGSSPHARGTLFGSVPPCSDCGIIPACAGNTSFSTEACGASGDHPRMRGEHRSVSVFVAVYWGSSPHARGTLYQDRWRSWYPGIIPACAGNTRNSSGSGHASRDHPRMRGEHFKLLLWLVGAWGLSPHARGTPGLWCCVSRLSGIIPACAGNTEFRSCGAQISGDHPRMRGEH